MNSATRWDHGVAIFCACVLSLPQRIVIVVGGVEARLCQNGIVVKNIVHPTSHKTTNTERLWRDSLLLRTVQ